MRYRLPEFGNVAFPRFIGGAVFYLQPVILSLVVYIAFKLFKKKKRIKNNLHPLKAVILEEIEEETLDKSIWADCVMATANESKRQSLYIKKRLAQEKKKLSQEA